MFKNIFIKSCEILSFEYGRKMNKKVLQKLWFRTFWDEMKFVPQSAKQVQAFFYCWSSMWLRTTKPIENTLQAPSYFN